MLTNGVPMLDKNGDLLGYRGVDKDITERKQAEKLLNRSEQRYREVVEGTDDLITQIDSKVVFTYVNHAARNIFGCSPEECVGLLALDFIYPEDRESTIKAFTGWVDNKLHKTTYENR